jgi:uncharacterized radical SAM protein YgiQ
MLFLPINEEDAHKRGWPELDIIFISGDAYIDHPTFGVPLLARLLESRGFRVGIIAQPDWKTTEAFKVLGRPRLFFAISAGAMDSMVAHYTPARKLRRDDSYTPGNRHGARPNRAIFVYTSRVKEAYKDVPVVIGGIEASLRRFAHYDFWEDRVRRSILLDAKADLLIYGMGEHPLLELAERVSRGEQIKEIRDIRGTAYCVGGCDDVPGFSGVAPIEIPSFAEVSSDPLKYAEAFRLQSLEMDPYSAATVVQRHGERRLVCNPPAFPLAEHELDAIYALPFAKAPHPSYKEKIPAYEQIKSSITTHRGCFGGCAFCAITHHQGKIIQSRSEQSILQEVLELNGFAWFKGSVSDVGGPTANMYGLTCGNSSDPGGCRRTSCLYPALCRHLHYSGKRAATLLRKVRGVPGIKHVAVSSGIRYDLMEYQPEYARELLSHHVGGLLKVAPEHLVDRVTDVMRKPRRKAFENFLNFFREESSRLGKKQYVVPYLISGHPGCTLADMVEQALVLRNMGLRVEQVQDFTPTPGTLSTCMYFTGLDPLTGENVYVPRSDKEKRLQKALLLCHLPEERRNVLQALKECGREDAAAVLLGSADAIAGGAPCSNTYSTGTGAKHKPSPQGRGGRRPGKGTSCKT